MLVFFFFKQKTAYEMRISDWSSDVCSSDLTEQRVLAVARPAAEHHRVNLEAGNRQEQQHADIEVGDTPGWRHRHQREHQQHQTHRKRGREDEREFVDERWQPVRSEEHTSELQSLMRSSYAVFCLKKKKKKINSEIISI